MKKTLTVSMVLLLLLLCGCNSETSEITETKILLDTAVTITAECDEQTLDGAFLLCEELEKLLSRTDENSEVYKLNHSNGFVTVSDDTTKIIESAIYYSKISGGKFDITVYPLSSIWDFKNQIVPDRSEISEALKNIDYHSIEIKGNDISLSGKKIDLGGIAKGYIADKLIEYFAEKGAQNVLINLGGNIAMRGTYNIGIKKPFSQDIIVGIELENKSAVTAGIYERYIEQNGKIYHHILDPKTGYGVENELASVTVVGNSSLECDALSTVSMLLGEKDGIKLIENTPDTEAVFIDRENNITLTSGLKRKNDKIFFKEGTK